MYVWTFYFEYFVKIFLMFLYRKYGLCHNLILGVPILYPQLPSDTCHNLMNLFFSDSLSFNSIVYLLFWFFEKSSVFYFHDMNFSITLLGGTHLLYATFKNLPYTSINKTFSYSLLNDAPVHL